MAATTFFTEVLGRDEILQKNNETLTFELKTVCLFCWGSESCEVANIIKVDEYVLIEAGMDKKSYIRNGLTLCATCHTAFDRLRIYVDCTEEEKCEMIVRVVDSSNHLSSVKGAPNLIPVTEDGKLLIQIPMSDPSTLPSRVALSMHRRACLIWQMAGGTEPEDIYYDSEEEDNDKEGDKYEKPFETIHQQITKWNANVPYNSKELNH